MDEHPQACSHPGSAPPCCRRDWAIWQPRGWPGWLRVSRLRATRVCREPKGGSGAVRRCGGQMSVTAGTIFHGSRKPLRLWFRARWNLGSVWPPAFCPIGVGEQSGRHSQRRDRIPVWDSARHSSGLGPDAAQCKDAGNWQDDAQPATSTLGTVLFSAPSCSASTTFRGIRTDPGPTDGRRRGLRRPGPLNKHYR